MSFLSRIFGGGTESDEPVRWSWPRIGILPLNAETGEFSIEIITGPDHQKAIKASRKLHQSRMVPVYLNREPRNSDDPNAVAVMSALQEPIGHLGQQDAARYADVLDRVAAAGLRTTCTARIVDGDRGEPPTLTIGLSDPSEISERLKVAVRESL